VPATDSTAQVLPGVHDRWRGRMSKRWNKEREWQKDSIEGLSRNGQVKEEGKRYRDKWNEEK